MVTPGKAKLFGHRCATERRRVLIKAVFEPASLAVSVSLRRKRTMGVMKFRLPSNEATRKAPDYRKAYITGLDRTPGRLAVELRNGVMTCVRESTESGRLFVPWPIEGFGMPLVGTATLAERPAPYVLAVELRAVSSTTSATSYPTGSSWGCGRLLNWKNRLPKPRKHSWSPRRPLIESRNA